jgi:hypothetical protein
MNLEFGVDLIEEISPLFLIARAGRLLEQVLYRLMVLFENI